MSRLKNKIKAALAKEGYTLTELATRMDISTGTLSNYFRRDGMKMKTALNLSDALADMTGHHLTLNDFRKDEA
jgi:lambda repressor-like predicted transcriptional regulator